MSENYNNNKHPECEGVNCNSNWHESKPSFDTANVNAMCLQLMLTITL